MLVQEHVKPSRTGYSEIGSLPESLVTGLPRRHSAPRRQPFARTTHRLTHAHAAYAGEFASAKRDLADVRRALVNTRRLEVRRKPGVRRIHDHRKVRVV